MYKQYGRRGLVLTSHVGRYQDVQLNGSMFDNCIRVHTHQGECSYEKGAVQSTVYHFLLNKDICVSIVVALTALTSGLLLLVVFAVALLIPKCCPLAITVLKALHKVK